MIKLTKKLWAGTNLPYTKHKFLINVSMITILEENYDPATLNNFKTTMYVGAHAFNINESVREVRLLMRKYNNSGNEEAL